MKPVVQNDLKLKILVLGESGTGKSNICTRFCRGNFSEYSNPTQGIQLSTRKFWGPFQQKQQLYHIVFWDADNNLEQSILPSLFKNVLGIIYVYDITNTYSLENLQRWRDLAYRYINSESYTEMLLGNKIDLINFREISPQIGRKWAIRNRIQLFYETSALLNLRIEEAIQKLAVCIIKKFDQNVKKPLKLVREEPSHRGCI